VGDAADITDNFFAFSVLSSFCYPTYITNHQRHFKPTT